MAFAVVVDACALYPYSLRDTLLRLAAAEFFDLYWSEEILDEIRRNLIENADVPEESADRVLAAMRDAFDGAIVPAEQIQALIPAMGNHDDDRHVLAAAKAIGAEQIITFNIKHFPDEHTSPLGIEAIHPSEFLLNQMSLDQGLVIEHLRTQAAAFKNPPWTLEELLSALKKVVPEFVQRVEEVLANG